jgi:hypothetical protein
MFDRSCSAYWCDDCGSEMVVDYRMSGEDVLTLACSRAAGRGSGCGFVRRFVKLGGAGALGARPRKPYRLALPGEGERVRVGAPDSDTSRVLVSRA